MKRQILTITLVGMLQACDGQSDSPLSRIELMDQWRAELIQADEAFAETIGREGLSRWNSFFSQDGAVIQEGTGEIRGAEAIQASMDAAASAITSFSWAPERAEVAEGGDLGYTVGRYQTTTIGSDGVEMLGTGIYVSIWRRQVDGSWKVEMDLGNPLTDPAPLSADTANAAPGGGHP
jgi:ketosteroid isomerase-like protein